MKVEVVESVLEKIDMLEESYLNDFLKMPEVLVLDMNTSILLKDELGKDFDYRLNLYHEYIVAVVDKDEEVIRFY